MVRCSACGSTFPENTLFCEECGSYLPPGEEQVPDAVAGPTEAKGGRAASKTLILSVQHGGRIELPLSKEVIIGRLDAERAVFPDVDFTNEMGIEKGLSRRHARISLREGRVVLEDLHSLNGTFLNATRLVPDLPYPLKDGDQVQLGKLLLTVYIK
jgi:pSer/pThr/pTyr-binding forkhead associated (FHA) protein